MLFFFPKEQLKNQLLMFYDTDKPRLINFIWRISSEMFESQGIQSIMNQNIFTKL